MSGDPSFEERLFFIAMMVSLGLTSIAAMLAIYAVILLVVTG